MIDPKLLAILRCPIGGGTLRVADPSLVQRVQTAIERGHARDRLDQKVSEGIDGGLVSQDGCWFYPIRRDIPALVAEEAIRLDSVP